MALGPNTTFEDFMALLNQKTSDIHGDYGPQMWHFSITAEARVRTVWKFFTQDVDVRQDTWDRGLEGSGEGRWKGFGVLCLREKIRPFHRRGKMVVRSTMHRGVRDW